jgi:hypothetical protein
MFSDSSNNSSGAVYISSGKMRGDFQSQDNGKTESSHMLNDGSFVYIWTDGQQNGDKMSLTAVKQEEAQVTESPNDNSPQPSQAVNMQQKTNYSCGPWVADASVFTVPTNVTFTDYSSMMQGSGAGTSTSAGATQQGASAHGSAAMCSECNQAPAGQARNQCLKSLHCE